MKFIKFFFYLSIVIAFAGCSGSTGGNLSDEKFADILTDIHLADGVIEVGDMHKKASETALYDYIYIKNGITREQFVAKFDEKIENPDEMNGIYKEVLARIENITKTLAPNSLSLEINEVNIWESKPVFFFPEDGEQDPIIFYINSDRSGTYKFSVNAQIFKDDGSVNPKLTIVIMYSDGTRSTESVPYVKNNAFTNYSVALKSEPGKQVEKISGWLYDHSSMSGVKHAVISDIKLTYLK